MALSRGAMGLTAVVIVVFPDHTHLLFLCYVIHRLHLHSMFLLHLEYPLSSNIESKFVQDYVHTSH